MSVSLQPSSTLPFQRPFTTDKPVKQTLTITNPNSSPVAFKVKTTAPKQYCVRPNAGKIEPGQSCQVLVLLQPMKEDPPPGTKCRDKFLVQSVLVTPGKEAASPSDLWSSVEAEKNGDGEKPSIHEQKIRCTYLPASEGGSPPNSASPGGPNASVITNSENDESNFDTVRPTSNGRDIPTADSAFSGAPTSPLPTNGASEVLTPAKQTSSPGAPPSYSTPAPVTDTLRTVVAGAGAAVAGAGAAIATTAVGGASPAVGDLKEKVASVPTTPVVNGASSTASEPSALTAIQQQQAAQISSLQSQLSAAQAEIKRLGSQLQVAETTAATLRSRGVSEKEKVSSGGAVPGTAQAVVEQKGQEGVPVQIVAGIVFGVFVFTWLFF
ncbi:PapD-like protein [Meredithblackwellia eburnea MCA 4105]